MSALGFIEVPLVDGFFHAEPTGIEIDVPPAQRQQFPDSKSSER